MEMSAEQGRFMYQLQRFCDTRFAQSEWKVYIAFISDYPQICALLEAEADKGGESAGKATELLHTMRSFDWLGRLLALTCLLELVKFLSLSMQTVNVLPWELIELQVKFKNTMDEIVSQLDIDDSDQDEAPIRSLRGVEQPLPEKHFGFMYRTADTTGKYPGTRHAQLSSGVYMGQRLWLSEEDVRVGGDDGGLACAMKSLGHNVADWCKAASHFFDVRFLQDIHAMHNVMAKCMDLRMFCKRGVGDMSMFVKDNVEESLRVVHAWMIRSGIVVADFEHVLQQCTKLASKLQQEVEDFYAGATFPDSLHRWHEKVGAEILTVSGTVIQEEVMTAKRMYQDCPDYIYMYQHCALKTMNEAVVEGMCSVVSRHATGVRGLSFNKYGMESIIVWNAPIPHKADAFLSAAVDLYFKGKKHGWRFFSVDTNRNRVAAARTNSVVIDRHLKEQSKFPFMEG
jgi:hypothetical protein